MIDRKYWSGAPDFVVEVIAKNTEKRDRGVKFGLYEKHGVREYWLMEPHDLYVEVYRREGERLVRVGLYEPEQTFVSTVLGNALIDVRKLFGLPDDAQPQSKPSA